MVILLNHFVDVNECESSFCDTNADCNNTVGSFMCECNLGFTGNGIICAGQMYNLSSVTPFNIQ